MGCQKPLDFILLGPCYPYRGGIADTQLELANALKLLGYNVEVWTFTHLYPTILFPGKTQYTAEENTSSVAIKRTLHAYHPFHWKKIAREINKKKPRAVVFRYWTPFLAPCWNTIAKSIESPVQKVGLVDNWVAHERRPWDRFLTQRFNKHMQLLTCLSYAVRDEIKQQSSKAVWGKPHPIAETLPQKMDRHQARKKLGLPTKKNYLLFFGLIRSYKGLDLALEAIKAHPDKNLLIVGECYENEEKYRRLIKILAIEKQVHFDNHYVSKDKAALYFSAADALILPYKSASQSGVIAMAYHFEKPLLVTNHKGLMATIESDKTGVVVQPNTAAIAQGITTLFDGENLLEFQNNLNQSKNNYSWTTYAKEWSNFIFNAS